MKSASRKSLRRILLPLAALSIASAASANTFFDEWPPGAKLFSETEMQPCEALWVKSLAISSQYWQQTIRESVTGDRKGRLPPPALVDAARRNLERSKSVSILEYARQSSRSVAKRDLGTTRKDLKEVGEDLAVLRSGSDERIGVRFSVQLSPAQVEERITDRLTWQCTFNVRLAQLTTKSAVVAMGGKKDPFPKVGEGGPNDPTPAPALRPGNGSPGIGKGITGVPLPKLSSAQVTACSEEIRSTQLASQGWGGDANQVAARLGRFQKDLFEGRCAGHPEAAAYIAGADKMLSNTQAGSSGTNPGGGTGTIAAPAGSPGGSSGGASGTLPPSASGGNSKQHNAAHSGNDCVAVYHEREMKALGYKNIMRSIIVNTCNYPVSVQWCIEAGNGGAGDCKPGYSNLADLGAKGTRGIDSNYQAVRYAACRHGPGMGFLPVAKDPGDPYRFACS